MGKRNRDGDNTGVIENTWMDRRLDREREGVWRCNEREGCTKTNIMWEKHNDSDKEIMKTRVDSRLHASQKKREGEKARRERKQGF